MYVEDNRFLFDITENIDPANMTTDSETCHYKDVMGFSDDITNNGFINVSKWHIEPF